MLKKDIIKKLLSIGTSLSKIHDLNELLEKITFEAKYLTSCDGGTLYLMNDNHTKLFFNVAHNDTLGIHLGGTRDNIDWVPLELYQDDANIIINKDVVAVMCAIEKKSIIIDDIYSNEDFNFEGAKKFDKLNNYQTKSMLVVPIKDHEENIIGVLQLINKIEYYENNKFRNLFIKRSIIICTHILLFRSCSNR